MDLSQTVSPLEVAWTVVNLAALVVCFLNLHESDADVSAMADEKRAETTLYKSLVGEHLWDAMVLSADGEQLDQRLIIGITLCNLTIGILAMLSLPGREPDGDPSLGSLYSPILFILSDVFLVWLSVSKRIRRSVIMGQLRKRP